VGETARYLATALPTPPGSEQALAWHRVTAGNPYFVDELARARVAAGSEAAALPGDLRRLIERRVQACRPETRVLLELAAVIGRDFPLALARRLSETALGAADFAPDALDAALAARLLEPADAPGHFRFVHALVPQAILAGLASRRVAALRGALGEVLAQEPALRATGRAEVARQLAAAAAVLPRYAEAARLHSTWAGYEAAAQHAHTLAAGHYRDALAALAAAGAPRDGGLERAALLVSLGHSLALSSPQDAEAVLEEAEALAEARLAARDRERAARLLGLAVVVRAQEVCPATAAACRREAARGEAALAVLGEETSMLRAQLLAALVPLLVFESDRERPAALAREALRVADATGDALAQGRALEALHWALLGDPSTEERLEVASRVLEEAVRGGSERLAATARTWRYLDLLELGRVEDAEADLAVIEDVANRLGEPRRRHQALTLHAGLALHRGRLAQAEALAAEALALGRAAGVAECEVIHEAVSTVIAFEREDAAGISNRVTQASALRSHELFQASAPVIETWQGRERSASEGLGRLQTRGFDAIPHGPDWLGSLLTLGWTAVYLQDCDAASELHALLAPHERRFAVFQLGAFTGPVARVLAQLAALLGRHDAAQRHLHAAFDLVERAGAQGELAHLHLERAELRLALGARAGADEVLEDLRRAVALARELGTERVLNRIRATHPELAGGEAPGAAPGGWFLRRGEVWSVGLGAAPPRELPDSRGLRFLAALLARPGEEVLATALVADVTGELDVPLERARLRITQRVRATLASLRELHPELAAHLASTVRTGNYCAYLPPADARVAWRL